jgi:hypothetical protein
MSTASTQAEPVKSTPADRPPPSASPQGAPSKPDADKAEPAPHERPPVRSDDN